MLLIILKNEVVSHLLCILAGALKLGLLHRLVGDNGEPLFPHDGTYKLEYELDFLQTADKTFRNCFGERQGQGTNVDVFIDGPSRRAIECKFTETDIGRCSKEKPGASCHLTHVGVKYWTVIPSLFNWAKNDLCDGCSLAGTYQLVRNILAACVMPDGRIDSENGIAVLLYDQRNPAFYANGRGMVAWQKTKDALRYPGLLQKCMWQEVISCIAADSDLLWLTQELNAKYGFM